MLAGGLRLRLAFTATPEALSDQVTGTLRSIRVAAGEDTDAFGSGLADLALLLVLSRFRFNFDEPFTDGSFENG